MRPTSLIVHLPLALCAAVFAVSCWRPLKSTIFALGYSAFLTPSIWALRPVPALGSPKTRAMCVRSCAFLDCHQSPQKLSLRLSALRQFLHFVAGYVAFFCPQRWHVTLRHGKHRPHWLSTIFPQPPEQCCFTSAVVGIRHQPSFFDVLRCQNKRIASRDPL